jgi:hypothetical protein
VVNWEVPLDVEVQGKEKRLLEAEVDVGVDLVG